MNLRRILRFLAAAVLPVFPGAFGQTAQFTAEARLVEVYATVFDQNGRYLDGLTRDSFQVLEDGQPQSILSFEASASDLSCALLLDTTGSMVRALPVVKNATLKLLDELRNNDWVAVYSFSTKLAALQDFTTDKKAAKNAVLRTRTSGTTALFDAISQLAKEVSRRSGKKMIVVFTDGQDNASVLNAGAAIARAKKIGVPVYMVAQGEALKSPALLRELKEIAQRTGGLSYTVKQSRDIEKVFQDISTELQHTYMLAYKPPPVKDQKWRTIRVAVSGIENYKIRAKQGYFPE